MGPADRRVRAAGTLPLLQRVGERLPRLRGHRRLQPDGRRIATHLSRPFQDELVVSTGIGAVARPEHPVTDAGAAVHLDLAKPPEPDRHRSVEPGVDAGTVETVQVGVDVEDLLRPEAAQE